MIQVKHVSFKDWNPIGKPHKKPNRKNGNPSENSKNSTLKGNTSLNIKTALTGKEIFGEAATLELMHSYVKDESDIKKHNINE